MVKARIRAHFGFLIFLFLYALASGALVKRYPPVGDDEGYLARFAYDLAQHGLPIVDPQMSYHGNFAGIPASPVSGSLYFGSLAAAGGLANFSLEAMRWHSLFFSLIALVLQYALALLLFSDRKKALGAAFLLGFSIQFIWSSHTIRQEAMGAAFLLFLLTLLAAGLKNHRPALLMIGALISSLGVCIHPNGVVFPAIYLGLVFFFHPPGGRPRRTMMATLLWAAVLGGGVFFFLDYWPYRGYYWELMDRTVFHGAQSQAGSWIKEAFLAWIKLGEEFWEVYGLSRYRQNLWILAMNILGIGGALLRPNRAHRIILFCLIGLGLLMLAVRKVDYYFVYLVPLFSLLTASVAVDGVLFWAGRRRALTLAAGGLLIALNALHPLGTIWAYRHYDFDRQTAEILSEMLPQKKALASSIYFFALPQNDCYPHQMASNGDLRSLVLKNRLRYILFDDLNFHKRELIVSQPNRKFFEDYCSPVKSWPLFHPSSLSRPNGVTRKSFLYDCGRALGEASSLEKFPLMGLPRLLRSLAMTKRNYFGKS